MADIDPAEENRAPAQPAPHDVVTLADVMRTLDAAGEKKGKNAEMRSALKMTGKILDRRLSDLPADPAGLRSLLASANPAVVGMSPYRWQRVRSLVLAALKVAGFEVMAGRDLAGLSPAWQALADQIPTQSVRIGLSRLMSFFSRKGIDPAVIQPVHFASFHDALNSASLHVAPQTAFNTAARRWNEAAGMVPGWPQVRVEIPADPRHYSLAWDAFPESFRADVDAFLCHSADQDPLSDTYAQSVSAATIKGRRRMIRSLASAVVHSGRSSDEVTDLSVLVEPETAKAAFRYLLGRNGGEKSPQIANIANLLCTLSRHWVQAPPEADAALRKMAVSLQVKSKGMRPKNRERLRQFDLDANVDALFGLPARVLEEVRRSDAGGKGEAVRVMMALAVELLIVAPMRLKNLTGLDVERHMVAIRRAGKVSHHIVIPAQETKTSVPLEAPLPASTVILLDAYLKHYRGRVCSASGPYLFPGRNGARRSEVSFSRLLTLFIKREVGVTMNTHLFRHLAAKTYLKARPNDIESVRQFLGHTSTRTTLKAYAELRTDDAFRRYDATILQRREAAGSVQARSNKTRSGRAS